MSGFPKMENHGKPEIRDGMITFSYLDSKSRAKSATMPVLTPRKIADMVKQRMMRFDKADPGARESETSRFERKYIAAHPKPTLILARRLLSEHEKMEFEMMFNANSHNGTSDHRWALLHAHNRNVVVGDDEQSL